MKRTLRGLIAAALTVVVLTGCISMPKQQAFNRQSHASVKTIAVLPTHKTNTSVFMLHHPGASFGLIGGLIAAGDQASKEKRFREVMEQARFEPLAYFRERLDAHLVGRGYTLVWPQSQVETGKVARGMFGLRKTYAPIQAADAQLDVNFGFVGYAAAGAGDGAPYRPTATVGVRLVSPDGQQNFYSDYVAYNNVFNLKDAVTLEADAKYSYPGFDDLHSAGPVAVDGLKAAIDSVAAEVARQL
jgi:hypothetical protein